MLIYKILLPGEWTEFEESGAFAGTPADRNSGFQHCATREQVGAVARRVYPDEPDLVLLALDPEPLGESLRWEQAPGRGIFPHVYGPLPRNAVATVYRVPGAGAVEEVLGPPRMG
jgi:uncharacterized protein (DUF952 family)